MIIILKANGCTFSNSAVFTFASFPDRGELVRSKFFPLRVDLIWKGFIMWGIKLEVTNLFPFVKGIEKVWRCTHLL